MLIDFMIVVKRNYILEFGLSRIKFFEKLLFFLRFDYVYVFNLICILKNFFF